MPKILVVLVLSLVLVFLFNLSCGVQKNKHGGIEGTVIDTNRNPAVGLSVSIINGTTRFPATVAVTNDKGFFKICDVPPGIFEVGLKNSDEIKISLGSITTFSGEMSILDSIIPTKDTLFASNLRDNPVYDVQVRVFGQVSLLGFLFCPCFELTSEGATLVVWYDLMIENDNTQRTAVDISGINNGDKVVIVGELKGDGGINYSKGIFWAKEIIRIFSEPGLVAP